MRTAAVSPKGLLLPQHTMVGNGPNVLHLRAAKNDRPSTPRVRVHLTPRQLDVLALLCEGLPNKLISRRLEISAATVKVHIGCILRELGVASRLQAVIEARRLGLFSDDADSSTAADRPSGQSVMVRLFLDELSPRQRGAAVDGQALRVPA
jgi:DNA-binding CsgD family transcriptional regulator